MNRSTSSSSSVFIQCLTPCLGVSVLRSCRAIRASLILAAAVTAGAVLLQWWWAGWSEYSGLGPPLGTRWLLTSSVGAALLLPPAAAVWGAASTRRLADTGLLEQLRITRWSAGRRSVFVAVRTLTPALLAVFMSAMGWLWVALAHPAALLRRSGMAGGTGALAIVSAHALAAVVTLAFGFWGAALAVARRSAESSRWGDWRRLGGWAPAVQLVLCLGPWLVGPLLPHLARPERALDATLILNPVTAVGAALEMDLLRSPRLYELTHAPEYWYAYPPTAAVAAVYAVLGLLGACQLRRALEAE